MDLTNTKPNDTLLSLGDFIDDYSHLRFSYYQEESQLDNSMATGSSFSSNDTLETNVSDIDNINKKSERNILQIPELPHPSCVVSSIISSASNRMNSGNMRFKYADRIATAKTQTAQVKFSPSRRSTLIPEKNDKK